MIRTRAAPRFIVLLVLYALPGCTATRTASEFCGLAMPSMADWTTHDEGAFTLRLPPEYTRTAARGIDSQVGVWEAPGKRVTYDLGFYSNPLQPNELTPFPELVVCDEGEGSRTPRVIRYRPAAGEFAAGAHWSNVSQQPGGRPAGLTIDGTGQRAADHGEFLQIVRSVQLQSP